MPLTSAQKQHRRRKALDEIAADLGYESHYRMMTAIINGEAQVVRTEGDKDDEPQQESGQGAAG